MENRSPEETGAEASTPSRPETKVDAPAGKRAQRWFVVGGVIVALLVIGVIVALVLLSIHTYRSVVAGVDPIAAAVVVGLLRDAAIIFVAFETLLIGILLIILMLQLHSLTVLLRDEIKPMLEAANETMTTVRGTTKFVSHSVVSPVMKWSSSLAGARRMLKEISDLAKGNKET